MKNNLQVGTEKYVQLFDGGEAECSLSATIINDQILYIVENSGKIEEHVNYNQALEEYIKTCFTKINGGNGTAIDEALS